MTTSETFRCLREALENLEELQKACKAFIARWDGGVDALTEAVEIAAIRNILAKL